MATAKLKAFEEYPAWEGSGLPTRENCDLRNPRQAFLWMFTGMPGVVGAPLIFPTEYWEEVSYHQWECGARPSAKPVKKYQVSRESMMNHWTAAGKWVDLSEPDAPEKTLADVVEEMSQADKIALREVVLDKMGLGGGTPRPDVPEGHMQVSELAARLGINVDRLITVLADFGMDVAPESYVDRSTGDRLVAHLGL